MPSKKWIQGIGIKKGALHSQLGVPQGKKIPVYKIVRASKSGGTLGKRARLAQTLTSFHKGGEASPDVFVPSARKILMTTECPIGWKPGAS